MSRDNFYGINMSQERWDEIFPKKDKFGGEFITAPYIPFIKSIELIDKDGIRKMSQEDFVRNHIYEQIGIPEGIIKGSITIPSPVIHCTTCGREIKEEIFYWSPGVATCNDCIANEHKELPEDDCD